VALPEIGRDLGYSAHTLQSVVSAYAVASSGFLLFGGRAADLLGRRRVFITGLALYSLRAFPGVTPQLSSLTPPKPESISLVAPGVRRYAR
jgi:MFS family permease